MAGEALTELASIAMTDEVMEDIGNKVEDVTKRLHNRWKTHWFSEALQHLVP